MQRLTATKSNVTDSQCRPCWDDIIFTATVTPYILISLPVNGWILWQMVSSPLFWTDRMKVHEFHLVLAELLVGLLEMVSNMMSLIRKSSSELIIVTLADSFFITRNEFLSLICVDRYLAVVHPVLYLRLKAMRYRMSVSGVVWMKNIGLAFIQLYSCDKHFVNIALHVLSFGWHFIISSFCCLRVLRALKHPSPGEGEKEESNTIKKRAFKIVLLFQVTTFMSNIPLISLFLLRSEIDDNMFCIWQPLGYSMMMWFGAVYPILYLRKARKTK